jgi:hypothetical protein
MQHLNLQSQRIKPQLVKIDKLRPHEEVNPRHFKELFRQIVEDRMLKFAIAVDKNTDIILDGEHRFTVLKEIGCERIPVVYVDYNSTDIEVEPWEKGRHITKKEVIEAGLGENRLPATTSKHLVRIGNKQAHISIIEKRGNMSLKILKARTELVNMELIRPSTCMEIKDALQLCSEFLKTGIVDKPVIVDKKTKVILNGNEVFYALDLLSAKKAPVLSIDISTVKIASLQSDSKPITEKTITKAGLKGPKLPHKSFNIIAPSIEVNFTLNELSSPEIKNKTRC